MRVCKGATPEKKAHKRIKTNQGEFISKSESRIFFSILLHCANRPRAGSHPQLARERDVRHHRLHWKIDKLSRPIKPRDPKSHNVGEAALPRRVDPHDSGPGRIPSLKGAGVSSGRTCDDSGGKFSMKGESPRVHSHPLRNNIVSANCHFTDKTIQVPGRRNQWVCWKWARERRMTRATRDWGAVRERLLSADGLDDQGGWPELAAWSVPWSKFQDAQPGLVPTNVCNQFQDCIGTPPPPTEPRHTRAPTPPSAPRSPGPGRLVHCGHGPRSVHGGRGGACVAAPTPPARWKGAE